MNIKNVGHVHSAHVKAAFYFDMWDSVFSYGEPTLDSHANSLC